MDIRKTVGASLLAAVLLAAQAGPAQASPAAAAPSVIALASVSSYDATARQKIIEIFDATNAFRAAKGLKPVKFNADISAISQAWSVRMAGGDYEHNPDYVTGSPAGWTVAAENIAWTSWNATGGELVDMWIASPPHNANLSAPGVEYLGVGAAFEKVDGVRGALYATQNFFGYRDGVVPPGSYNHPSDYFAGKPELAAGSVVMVTTLPPAPTWNLAGHTYTIPAVEGIQYEVYGPGEPWGAPKAPGTYTARKGTYQFHPVAKSGYGLEDTSRAWTAIFGDVTVTAAAPVFDKVARTVTIPDAPGVRYLLDGWSVPAGVHSFVDSAKVDALADNGYVLTGTQSWSTTVPLVKAVPAEPTFDRVAGTYTIPSSPGVIYLINYQPVAAGTYKSRENVIVRTQAATGYLISDDPIWTLTLSLQNVTAAAPKFTTSTGQVLIPATAGVQYLLNRDPVAAGTYTVHDKVVVMARAMPGYRLNGGGSYWTRTFPAAVKDVTATAPSFNRYTGKFTIRAKTGVAYYRDGKLIAAGTYTGKGTKVAITAKASTGYRLTGTSSWTYDYRTAVTAPKPAMSSKTDKYTIPAVTGVTYYVDGQATKAGTYTAVNGRTMKFSARASATKYRITGASYWSYRF